MLWYMGERLTGNFDQHHVDGFEAMQEDGNADSYSEAVRRASIVGLQDMGYINGERKETALKTAVNRFAWLFTIAGMVGIGFTVAYPVPARLPSFAVAGFGVVLFAVHKVLAEYEPKVSNRLKRIVGRSA